MEINVKINNVKNIKSFNYTFNFKDGIYALVGENAVGKSTVMSAIASTVYMPNLRALGSTEVNESSIVSISAKGQTDEWNYNASKKRLWTENEPRVRFNGIYEGSIFSGTRFEDMKNIDKMIAEDKVFVSKFIPAHPKLQESLSTILRNEAGHYKELYKLSNMDVARKYNLSNMPYFFKLSNGDFISKYKMSSGECMLISLLNFINSTALVPQYRRRLRTPIDNRMFIFIDEVELALHPSSIVRLVEYLQDMCSRMELTVLFSSHSTELIKMIKPRNIFFLSNTDGDANIMTPCYPHYAIRSLYNHDGNDCTVLVEDHLSEILVKQMLIDYRVKNNLLINVLPVGSWGNTLSLQERIFNQNIMGRDKFVFSILDGDVKDEVNKVEKFKHLRKLFLPIYSIEKFLYSVFIANPNAELIRVVGNRLFTYKSLETIIREYKLVNKTNDDKDGKKLYSYLIDELDAVKLSEKEFINSLSEVIMNAINFDPIKANIERFIDDNFHIEKK
ncbi:MAG: AAA family ATPase [bacterium]